MPTIKDTHFHARLDKSVGTKKEWDKLIELAKMKTVRGVLNSVDDTVEDINYLLTKQLKESPLKVKRAKGGKMENWLIIGCVHRPFHNKKLWSKLLQLIIDIRKDLTGIIIAGDYLDLESLGSYSIGQKGNGVSLMDEYEDGLEGLLEIESALGRYKKTVKKIFTAGNHEQRFFKWIKKIDSSKYGGALLSPMAGLRLEDLGYEVITDYMNGLVLLGNNLEVFHGQYFSKHAASKHLDEAKGKSVLFFHTHRFQVFSNSVATAYNLGGMYDAKSPCFNYATRQTKSNWSNGFGIAHIDKNGGHIVSSIQVINESFFYNGKIY